MSGSILIVFVKKHTNLRGLNVTAPHKISIIKYLDNLHETAKKTGAVNAVKISESGKLTGYNTDVVGFVESIKKIINPTIKTALILGTGGAAKAVFSGLNILNIKAKFVSRDTEKVSADTINYSDLTKDNICQNLIIVNASPVGMFPEIEKFPKIPYQYLTKNHILFDLIYNPEETIFLKKGKKKNATTKNGLEMLHLQAEAAWEYFNC